VENCAGCGRRFGEDTKQTHCASCRRRLLSGKALKYQKPPETPAILRRGPTTTARDPRQLTVMDDDATGTK